jgi:hypothetical protein
LQVEPAKDDVGLGTGRRLQQRRHTCGAAGQDARVGSIGAPSLLDPYIAADGPAERLKRL